VDSAGNVYVADSDNDTIRKVTGSGVVTTIGGNPGVIGGADGIGASANFAGPDGVAVDANGRIYVADSGNNRISKGTPMPVLSITASAMGISVSWLTPFTGFVLQQNSDLGNALGWSTTTYNVSDDGTNDSITVLSPAGNLFFRLTHP
jgi:hypothetical protein